MRDRWVAETLAEAGFTTLQPELLDARQSCDPCNALDVELHGSRLLHALDWLDQQPWAASLPVGLFGAGIGSGVALLAAAKRPQRTAAVVCRDGRPDTALFHAASVTAATLMLVEEDGWPYRQVYDALPVPKETVVIPSERHTENPGAIGPAVINPPVASRGARAGRRPPQPTPAGCRGRQAPRDPGSAAVRRAPARRARS